MVRAHDAPVETSKFMGHGVCDNQTKSVSLTEYTSDLNVITRTVLSIMKSLNIPPHELRGIGIQITKLNEEPVKKDSTLMNMFSKVAEKQKNEPIKTKEIPTIKEVEDNSIKSMFSKVKENITEKAKENITEKVAEPLAKPKLKKKNQPTGNIKGLFQNMPSRKRTNEYLLPDDIDESVLAELPQDIRLEILQEQNNQLKLKAQKNETPVIEIFEKSPTPIEQENENKYNIFLQKDNCRLLLAWMQSTDDPEDFDVNLIIQNATDLVEKKESHVIYDPIAFICR